MTILLIHLGTNTIIDAADDVIVIDTDDLSIEEAQAVQNEDLGEVANKGTDVMKMIRYYMGVAK